jgi:hypothetical protein
MYVYTATFPFRNIVQELYTYFLKSRSLSSTCYVEAFWDSETLPTIFSNLYVVLKRMLGLYKPQAKRLSNV